MSQNKTLHLIEPTLYDQTGHSYSYIQSLIAANKDFHFDLHVWLDRRGKHVLNRLMCTTHNYFYRPIRRLQKVFLYKKLLQQPGTIFIGTTELLDLQLLSRYATKQKPKAQVVLHFHQFKQTAAKLASLKKIAALGLPFKILTPTTKLQSIFTQFGFNCFVVPCPSFYPAPKATFATAKFNKILYAGAARNDKGFPIVVNLLQHFRAQNNYINFEIQISTPSSQRYDSPTEHALQLLQQVSRQNLILHTKTLAKEQYVSLFNNAICLLIYDQQEYSDKFSGIALDAFYAGCPIITATNTWMGDTAQRYNAGIALSEYSNAIIEEAIKNIMSDYPFYQANAKRAAIELARLHDPKNTLAAIDY